MTDNPNNTNKARQIFLETIELPNDQRAAAIDAACEGDAELRAQVDALLEAHHQAEGFMDSPTASTSIREAAAQPTESAGARIGRYVLLQSIGEGGFGSVWMAEQRRPVKRRVALKIIKLGMDTKQVIARFEAERQALALMDHPNIAKVLDAGATTSGRPYFVMEYVIGDSITKFADAHKLGVRDRLELFAQVCAAVQHAHTKGIIHRDLKPSNVLVSMLDGRPFVKIIDFGIAKATASPLTDKTYFTEHRQLIGTLEYMSPEQAEGSPDIDTRTDLYALGVMLYELLTGKTPFDGARLRSAAWHEMQRIIREEEPPAPSIRLSKDQAHSTTAAATRQTDPARLSALIHGELDWIVMKSIDKDRARRYESPAQLAADLDRHLRGEAVEAAPPSAAYRFRKFVRRNKGPVTAGAAIAAILLIGITVTGWALNRAIGAEREISAALDESRELREQESELRAAAEEARTRADEAALDSRHASLISRSLYLRQQLRLTESLTALDEAHQIRPAWDSMLIAGQIQEQCRDTWDLTNVIDVGVQPHAICLIESGRRLVAAAGPTLKLYDVHTSELLRQADAPVGLRELRLLRGDETHMLAVGPNWLRVIHIHRLETTASMTLESGRIVEVDSSNDQVVITTTDRRVIIYDKDNLSEAGSMRFPDDAVMRDEQELRALAFSPDGRWVVAGGRTFTNDRLFWDRQENKTYLRSIFANVFMFCDNDTLITTGNELGTNGNAIQAVDLHTMPGQVALQTTPLAEVPPEEGLVDVVTATPNAEQLAFRTQSGLATLTGYHHSDVRRRLATDRFSSLVGRTSVAVSAVFIDTNCRSAAFAMRSHVAICNKVVGAQDWISPVCLDDRVYHIDYNTRQVGVRVTDTSRDKRTLASGTLEPLPHTDSGWRAYGFDAAVSLDGRTIAVRVADKPPSTFSLPPINQRIRIFRDLDPETLRPVGRDPLDIIDPPTDSQSIRVLHDGSGLFELSPDGSRLLIGTQRINAPALLYNTDTGSAVAQWDEQEAIGSKITAIPGRDVFAALAPGSTTINLHRWDTGAIARSIPLGNRRVGELCASDDGALLAVSVGGDRIHIFDTATGEEQRQLQTRLDPIAWSDAAGAFVGYLDNPAERTGDFLLADPADASVLGTIAQSRSRGGSFTFINSGQALAYRTNRHDSHRPMTVIHKQPPAAIARALGRGSVDGNELPLDSDLANQAGPEPGTTAWLTERLGTRIRYSGAVVNAVPTKSGGHWTIYLDPGDDGLMIFIRARNLPRFESALGVPITELVGQTIEIEGELSLYGGYLPSLAHRVQIVFNEDTEVDLNVSR